MHKAVLSRLEPLQRYGQVSLVWSSKRLTVFAAFCGPDGRLAWVAKVARHPTSIPVLLRENKALRYLEPWADTLRIPRILSWDRDVQSACLVQTGIDGQLARFHFGVDASARLLAQVLEQPFAWIERLGQLVPPPSRITLGVRLDELLVRLQNEPVAAPVVRILTEARERTSRLLSLEAGVVHGDFTPGNLVLTKRGLGVVDWEEFGAGFPLQDLFTILCNCDYYIADQPCDLVETYAHVLFSHSATCRFALSRLELAGLDRDELRFCFYAYLGTMIGFQKAVPESKWIALLSYLGRFGYPAPGTVLPPPSERL